jgi:6-pyruvoyltetrahydropterin/6-carboxytetrahydropterin synthase
MFEVSVEHVFSAGHSLRNYKGKCENIHGHNYRVRVTVEGEKLDHTGLLLDFTDMRAAIKALADRLDHQFLNDLPPFDQINPSAENIAKYFSDGLQSRIQPQGVHVQAVTVWETDAASATFRPVIPSKG